MEHLLIADFETASLKVEDGPVEVAWIEVDDDLNVLEEVQSLLMPYGPISPSAAGIHGITGDMVADKPTFRQFMEGKGNPFRGKKVLVIGHNIAFDLRYGNPEFGEAVPLCTLKLARRIYPDVENHKLPTLLYTFGLQKRGTHNALDDVYTCRGLLLQMMQDTGLDLEGLFNLHGQPLPIKKMPFGKHKGTLLKELPSSYVSWLFKQDNVDPDLLSALRSL